MEIYIIQEALCIKQKTVNIRFFVLRYFGFALGQFNRTNTPFFRQIFFKFNLRRGQYFFN